MRYAVLFLSIIMLNCAHITLRQGTEIESGMAAEQAAELFERGNIYFKGADYANALTAFEQIITAFKSTEPYEHALYLGAFCQYKLARFKNAVAHGEKYLKEFPSSKYSVNALSLVGESYFNLAQDYEAAYYLTKYYIQSEDSTGRHMAFERTMEILPGLSVAALEKLHRIFMAEDIDEHILYHLAQLEAQQGNKDDAERDFNLLLRRFPDTKYLYEAEEYKRFLSLGQATGRAGVLLPLTGKFSDIGENLLQVIRVFEKDKSLPFSLHVIDTKSDPIEATLAAARLVDEVGIDFLIAPVSSFEAFSVSGYAYGKTVPIILPLSTEARFESIPLVFTRGYTGEEQARMIARYSIYDLNIKRFAVLTPDDNLHRSIAQAFAQEVTRNNREVVALVSFPGDSITLQTELEAIERKEPEALFLSMETDMVINIAPQVAYYGLESVTLLGTESFQNERVPRLGEKYVEGAVFAAPAAIDEEISKQLTAAGLRINEFSAHLYSLLRQLRGIRNYERANLPRLINEILRGTEIYSIYQIKEGEFVKLTDISENEGQF